jgi:non-heme chloroperoxidase
MPEFTDVALLSNEAELEAAYAQLQKARGAAPTKPVTGSPLGRPWPSPARSTSTSTRTARRRRPRCWRPTTSSDGPHNDAGSYGWHVPHPERAIESFVQARTIPVEHGGELHVVECGSGPAIVFIPGWTMDWTVFEHQVELLSRCWRVIAFDPRGHGRTPATMEGNRYRQQGRDLANVVSTLELDRFALVGWSFGAYAAFEYIEEVGTERVTHVVSIDQPPCSRASDVRATWAEFTWDEFGAFIDDVGERREQFVEEFVSWLVSRSLDPAERDWLRLMHLTTPTPVATLLAVDGALSDYTTLVERLDGNLPVLHAVSQESHATAAPWLAEHSPNARLVTIPSHMGFWEDPDEFNADLSRFLSS